jgi:hypothetical protein
LQKGNKTNIPEFLINKNDVMKKMIKVSYLGFLLLMLSGCRESYSQCDVYSFSPQNNSTKNLPGDNTPINFISVDRALKERFDKMYPGATKIYWSIDDSYNSRLCFEWKGMVIRAGFNNKTQLKYVISTYCEELLPRAINIHVEETYFEKRNFGETERGASYRWRNLTPGFEESFRWKNMRRSYQDTTTRNVVLFSERW